MLTQVDAIRSREGSFNHAPYDAVEARAQAAAAQAASPRGPAGGAGSVEAENAAAAARAEAAKAIARIAGVRSGLEVGPGLQGLGLYGFS
jgi:hypothetical protein